MPDWERIGDVVVGGVEGEVVVIGVGGVLVVKGVESVWDVEVGFDKLEIDTI